MVSAKKTNNKKEILLKKSICEIGKNMFRSDAFEKVRGETKYAADFYKENMLWVGVKRALVPHAKLLKIDFIMSLRTQTERHSTQNYASLKDYASDFCITKELVGDRDILLLHPGPVNRNIDIDDAMLEDSRCKVLEQVKNGMFTRAAVLDRLINDPS